MESVAFSPSLSLLRGGGGGVEHYNAQGRKVSCVPGGFLATVQNTKGGRHKGGLDNGMGTWR